MTAAVHTDDLGHVNEAGSPAAASSPRRCTPAHAGTCAGGRRGGRAGRSRRTRPKTAPGSLTSGRIDDVGRGRDRLRPAPHPPNADDITREIEVETERHLAKTGGKVVSADPIYLTVHSVNVPNLTLVDMPGARRRAVCGGAREPGMTRTPVGRRTLRTHELEPIDIRPHTRVAAPGGGVLHVRLLRPACYRAVHRDAPCDQLHRGDCKRLSWIDRSWDRSIGDCPLERLFTGCMLVPVTADRHSVWAWGPCCWGPWIASQRPGHAPPHTL